MAAGETLLVALAIDGNVLEMTGFELLHSGFDNLHATLGPSRSGRDVGMKTSAVPFSLDGLGLEGNLHAELFSDAVEEETRHPEVITHCDMLDGSISRVKMELTLNTRARANLVLPLGRHDLGVDTRNLDAGIHASAVVSLNNVAAVDLASTDTAVIGSLGTGESTTGPAVRPSVGAKKSILLLKTEPELLLGVGLHQAGGIMTEVELVGGAIRVPSLTEDEDVLTEAEGIRENGNGAKIYVGVVAGGLACGGAVEVPFGEFIGGFDRLGEGLKRLVRMRWANRNCEAGICRNTWD